MESTILLKLVLQALGCLTLILVAILDYASRKRTIRFRRVRLILFVMLGVLLIFSIISVYEDDRNIRQENRQLTEQIEILQAKIQQATDSAAYRDSILIKQIVAMQARLDTFMRKAGTKPLDISDRKELNKLITNFDRLKAEIQKKEIFPVYIDVNPNRVGAEIFVDEIFKGAAPCSILIESGVHNLKVVYTDRSIGYEWKYEKPMVVSDSVRLFLKDNDFIKAKLKEEQ